MINAREAHRIADNFKKESLHDEIEATVQNAMYTGSYSCLYSIANYIMNHKEQYDVHFHNLVKMIAENYRTYGYKVDEFYDNELKILSLNISW